jgi:glycosyltransferase involved in cell wall biosynthesis
MTLRRAAFVVPGDINTLTGGYIYDRTVFDGLRTLGVDMTLVELGTSFPNPSDEDLAQAAQKLAAIEADRPMIFDGLAFGAIDQAILGLVKPPIVAMIHHPLALESGISLDERNLLFENERRNLRHAAHIVVPSPHTAQTLMQDYGVDESQITIARPGTHPVSETAQPADPPMILAVGIQVPRKGHDVLLKALSQMKHLEWQAVIAGGIHNDAYAQDLIALLDECGVKDRVRFVGRVPKADLGTLYAQARIFALATRYEGYGIVFDEAMVHGLPIVTCRVGAVPDTVDPNAGILVEPDDPDAFAAALIEVLENAPLRDRMAKASASAGAALPTWGDTVDLFDNVLNRVREGTRDKHGK